MKYIPRETYLNRLFDLKGTSDIKIITGVHHFIAIKGNEKIYIQVSDNISDENTFKREYEPLLKIRDAYPKMIVARTRHPKYSYEGIQIIDIKDWLLEK